MRRRPPGEWSRWRRRELSLASRRRTRLSRLRWLAEPRPPRVQRRSLPLVLYRKRSRLSMVAMLAVAAVVAGGGPPRLGRQKKPLAPPRKQSQRPPIPPPPTLS